MFWLFFYSGLRFYYEVDIYEIIIENLIFLISYFHYKAKICLKIYYNLYINANL